MGTFQINFMGIINNFATIKQFRIKQRTEGWINTKILKSIKDRDKAFGEFKKFKTEDKNSVFKELCNKTHSLTFNAKRDYFKDKLEND